MGASTIASLLIAVGIDAKGVMEGSAKVEDSIKEMAERGKGHMFGMSKAAEHMTQTLGLVTAGGLGAVVAGATLAEKHVEETGQAAFEMAHKFGIAEDQASQWLVVAGKLNVSTDTLEGGFKRLGGNLENLDLANSASDMKALEKTMKEGTANADQLAKGHQKLADIQAQGAQRVAAEQAKLANAKTPAAHLAIEQAIKREQDATASSIAKQTEANAAMAKGGAAAQLAAKEQLDLAASAKPVQQVLDQLGVKTKDAAGHQRSMTDIMLDAADAFSKLPEDVDKSQLAIKLFGKSGDEMLPILEQGKAGLQGMMGAAKDTGEALGKDQVEAAHKAVLAHKEFDAALTGVVNTLASDLLPVATQAFGWLKDNAVPAVRNLVSWLKGHKDAARDVAIVVGTVLLLAVVLYTAAMINAAVATIAASWPILAVVAAVVIVTAAVMFLVRHWNSWSASTKLLVGYLLFVLGPIGWIILAITLLITHWKQVQAVMQQLWAWAGPYVMAALGAISAFIGEVLRGLGVWWKAHGAEVAQVLTFILGFFAGIFNAVVTVVGAVLPTIWAIIRGVFTVIFDILHTAWDVIATIFTVALDLVTGHWSQAWKDLGDGLKAIWHDISTTVGDELKGVERIVLTALATLLDKVAELDPTGMVKNARDAINKELKALDAPVTIATSVHASPVPTTAATGHAAGHGALMAAGGIVTKPTLATIGEAGPEVVIPLSQLGSGATGGQRGPLVGSMTINNPKPEPAGTSTERELRKLAYLGST